VKNLNVSTKTSVFKSNLKDKLTFFDPIGIDFRMHQNHSSAAFNRENFCCNARYTPAISTLQINGPPVSSFV